MRLPALPIAFLAAAVALGLASGLSLPSAPVDGARPPFDAPGLAQPVVEADRGREQADTPAEHCGPTRHEVVRRVTGLGESEALLDILPPIRWEVWPEVVRACQAYGRPWQPSVRLSRRR